MPGADASQYTRFKKYSTNQAGDTQQTDPKSVNRLTQYISRVSNISNVEEFLPSLTKVTGGSTGPPPPATIPDPPTFGITTNGTRQLTINWIAPINNGGSSITGYTVTFNGESRPLGPDIRSTTFTGLTPSTFYPVSLYATNSVGNSTSVDTTVRTSDVTSVTFDTPGTYSWTPPAGVTSVVAICIGGGGGGAAFAVGGGGGGGLAWSGSVPVQSGTTYNVTVGAGSIDPGNSGPPGGDSSFGTNIVNYLIGYGGNASTGVNALVGGGFGASQGIILLGGRGGNGGGLAGGGGGAGGYGGNGGNGGNNNSPGMAGNGGGGGGGGGSDGTVQNINGNTVQSDGGSGGGTGLDYINKISGAGGAVRVNGSRGSVLSGGTSYGAGSTAGLRGGNGVVYVEWTA